MDGCAESRSDAAEADRRDAVSAVSSAQRYQRGPLTRTASLANDAASDARPPAPKTRHSVDLVQLSRAATPHTITGPALPNGAPFGPVMNPSLASFKMRNSSVRRPR